MKISRLSVRNTFLIHLIPLLAAGMVGAGTIQFSAPTFKGQEKKGSALITVTHTPPGTNVVTVHYATSNGTASAGEDYTATEGTLTFSNKAAKLTFTIPIINDSLSESNETVNLTLSDPTGGDTLGANSNAILTIQSDDKAGTIQFGSPKYSVNENAGNILITVKRAGGAASGVMVDYATVNGTAIAGNHYTAVAGTLTFGSNELTKTFEVPITRNQAVDGNTTLTLQLSNLRGGAILKGNGQAVLTIVDEESSLQFSQATYSASEIAPSVLITVNRTGPITGSNSVQWATSDGTAMAGSDYNSVMGILTFPPGMKARTFTVPILADSTLENTETVNIALSNPTGGALLGTQSIAVINIANKPDPNAVPVAGTPFMKFTVNGTAVTGQSTGGYDSALKRVTIGGAGTTGSGTSTSARAVTINVFNVTGPGTFPLGAGSSEGFGLYTITALAGSGAFNTTGSAPFTGSITIDVFDTPTKTITGRFSFVGSGFTTPSSTTIATITNGSFRMKYQ